jgi:putative Mg2+ transporter-C (MgtC) family protein
MEGSLQAYFLRLVMALAVGGFIGLERELRGKPAGTRTNMLICLGSCLLMIISIELARHAGAPADPARIAAQAVSGIGFLGAGTIIRSRFHVTGLTSAATIWALAALGLAIGAGYLLISLATAGLIGITLTAVPHVEKAILKRRATHVVSLVLTKRDGVMEPILAILHEAGVTVEGLEIDRSRERPTVTFEYPASIATHGQIIERLAQCDGVERVTHV